MKVISRDPQDLRLHPIRKHIPPPDKESAEWLAFVASVDSADGVQTPIFIAGDRVIDGWWRVAAARQLQLKEVPCIERDEMDAPLIVAESLLARKTMTRGAALYLVLQIEPEYIHSAEQRRLRNVSRNRKSFEKPLIFSKASNCPSDTILALCERFGVHVSSYKQARHVIKLFAEHPEVREEFEPQLLDGRKNLWNVLSAIGGEKEGGNPVRAPKSFFSRIIYRDFDAFADWGELDEVDRQTFRARALAQADGWTARERAAVEDFAGILLDAAAGKKGKAA